MDSSSQFVVPTIIDVPELIVTNDDMDYDDTTLGFESGAGFWSGKLQFLSSSLCYTIGLGNLWRFPYLCYKHAGGAYLAAYTVVIIVIGLPLLLMELAFGQYANEGPITIWRISPAFEGIGYSMCLISSLVAVYYNCINTWLMQYLFSTITWGPLPWTSCDNRWNSEHCFLKPEENFELTPTRNCTNVNVEISRSTNTNTTSPINVISTSNNTNDPGSILSVPSADCSGPQDASSFDKIFNATNEVELPANEYFHRHLLGIANRTQLLDQGLLLGSWNWNLIFCLTLGWLIVFVVLLKNLRPSWSSLSLSMLTSSSLGSSNSASLSQRVALISLIMPHLALFALLVRALTLPGASTGVAYYLTPEWERLQNIDIWADAITQIFYSMSPCWGGIITLANMNKFHNNFHSNTIYLAAANYATSLASGLAAFATLGFISTYSGVKINEAADAGIGFIFQVYPEALAQMPLTKLNAFIFFAILLLVGLSSQLTVMETVITTIVDTWPHKLRYRRPLVLMLLCASLYVLSLPLTFGTSFYLLQTLDAFAGTLTGMLIGILELIAIAWVYGMENFMQDIDDMISVHRNLFPSRAYWYFMWRYLTPSSLFAVLLFTVTDMPAVTYREVECMPGWMSKLGWTLSGLCAVVIPMLALVRLALAPSSGSLVDRISYLCRPSEDWAPSSYISGPKLLNRHQMLDERTGRGYSECVASPAGSGTGEAAGGGTVYAPGKTRGANAVHALGVYRDQDIASDEEGAEGDVNESLRRANDDDDDDDYDDEDDNDAGGRPASYIIAEEEDDDDDDDDDDESGADVGLISTSHV